MEIIINEQFYHNNIATNLPIWLANLPLSIRVHTMLLGSLCCTTPFERNVWCVQVAHLCSAARALSSRRFQLSTNLDEDFFCYLWYCGKKCGLACSVLLSMTRKHHHSGQNLLWTHLVAPRQSTTSWPLWWGVFVVDKSTDHAKPCSIC